MLISFIIILLGSPNEVGSARYGLNALLDIVRPEVDSVRLAEKLKSNATFRNQYIAFPVLYTFPPGIKCFKVTTDDSRFARVIIKTLYEHVSTPSFLNNHIDGSGKRCLGNIVIASNLSTLVALEDQVIRDAKLRMVCLVETSTQREIEDVLENELHRFGDSEFTIFSWGVTDFFYRVGQPVRTAEKIAIDANFQSQSNTIWQLNNEITDNFFGRTIRISTYNCDRFSQLGPIHPDGTSGSDATLFKEIAARINVTYKFVKPAPGILLGEFINGTWVGGMYENIATGKADLVICGNWLESSKYTGGLHPSVPIMPLCATFMVRRPEQLNDLFLVFLPFHYSIWLLIAGSQIAFSVFVSAFTVLVTSVGYRREIVERYTSLSYTTFKIYGMLVNECWPRSKDEIGPLRHLFTWWVVFCLLISSGYSSTLISRLTKPDYSKKPKNVADLVKGGYFWITEFLFPTDRLWDLSDPYFRVWAFERYKRVDYNEKLSILRKNPKATIAGMKFSVSFFGPFFNALPTNLTDDFEAMDTCIASVFHVIVHRAGSPFIDTIDYYITRFQESGLVSYYMREALLSRKMPRPVQLLNSDAKRLCRGDCSPRALELNALMGIFVFLLIGWLVASVVFISEVITRTSTADKQKSRRFQAFPSKEKEFNMPYRK